MIRAHKVLAAYACLAPRIVTGAFDPTRTAPSGHRPATTREEASPLAGSWIAGGLPVLPEENTGERFQWLEAWIAGPEDVIRTYGTESNVKENIRRLQRNWRKTQPTSSSTSSRSSATISATSGNWSGPRTGAGPRRGRKCGRFRAASGSAGTLGAGDISEGAVRLPNRGGRGARMPHHALTTDTGSTTSRGSGTSTSRSSITSPTLTMLPPSPIAPRTPCFFCSIPRRGRIF